MKPFIENQYYYMNFEFVRIRSFDIDQNNGSQYFIQITSVEVYR